MNMRMRRFFYLGTFLIGMILVACSGSSGGENGGGSVINDPLEITNVTIISEESVPIKLKAYVTGSFTSSCTTIKDPKQSRDHNRFMIEIMTERPRNHECGLVEGKYSETFNLELQGLPAGYYILDVNGVEESFSLVEDYPR